jgi:thiol-disulfide isomerase/thioredoxin
VKRLVPALLLVLVLAGCSADPLADQYQSGTNQNYISGDGTLTLIAPADRGDPIEYSSETDAGEPVSSSDFAGEVVVINFWYAACPPCRVEAPDLEALHQAFDGEGAAFLGVNVRDQAETAAGFEKEFGITYPSVIDTNDGTMLLAFAGTVAPNAVPTTLVIDKQGRVAARFLGLIEEPTTLKTIIAETIAE